jgi:hypothetical protein
MEAAAGLAAPRPPIRGRLASNTRHGCFERCWPPWGVRCSSAAASPSSLRQSQPRRPLQPEPRLQLRLKHQKHHRFRHWGRSSGRLLPTPGQTPHGRWSPPILRRRHASRPLFWRTASRRDRQSTRTGPTTTLPSTPFPVRSSFRLLPTRPGSASTSTEVMPNRGPPGSTRSPFRSMARQPAQRRSRSLLRPEPSPRHPLVAARENGVVRSSRRDRTKLSSPARSS